MRGKNLVTWLDLSWLTDPGFSLATATVLAWASGASVSGILVEKRLPLNTYAAYFVPRPILFRAYPVRPKCVFTPRNFCWFCWVRLQPAKFVRWVQKLLRWLLPCALFVPLWSLNNQQQQQHNILKNWQRFVQLECWISWFVPNLLGLVTNSIG